MFPLFVLLLLYAPAELGFLPEEWVLTSMSLTLVNGIIFHVLVFLTCVLMFFHIDRSITLRILTEFSKSPDGTLNLDGLKQIYSVEIMIKGRLEVMNENGYSRIVDGRYKLAPRGRLAVHLFRISRKMLKLKRV